MTSPDASRLYEVTEATWPPARAWRLGPWMIREGLGGGQRVSATTRVEDFTSDSIEQAERAMTDLRQPMLFMIRPGDEVLDAELAARGYAIKDPVVQYTAPAAALAEISPPPIATFLIWPPLAIITELWAEQEIGSERIDVMNRVSEPKTGVLARQADRAAGCAFVAVSDDVAMVHAIVVAEHLRRKGAALNMIRAAAQWAASNKAEHLSLVVTTGNVAANSLYSRMGMTQVGGYHYRIQTPE